ncbi:MAG: NUDIX hydrolase [Sneathiellaceae bacterium]
MTEMRPVPSAEDNPWTILGRTELYRDPWLAVHRHEVLNPVGRPHCYTTVHLVKFGIGVLPVDGNGCTRLVGQYRFPLRRYSWEIPEGGGDRDGAPQDGAARELREETGLTAASWLPILDVDMSNGLSDERAFGFIAWDLSEGEAEPEESEVLAQRHVPLAELYAMIDRGEIRDALTILVALRARCLAADGRLPADLARHFPA